ncbi:hypothetical protein Afil01_61490 [Actinorhabdospora filicis]|uniref:PAS domain-containing protein n=1 Tax=Actinorhabdospora filicis TaxID=1785913 RepID=A0A9W6SS96_9ACTN|nr:hypothetical protein [Actinorhabdospora filicis]GLZ81342.1 hypothetical protein Afil01_61490 [Actinorhabdospora filicis]
MPFVELTLSGDEASAEADGAILERWTTAVRGAGDPCLLLNARGLIAATSPTARELLGLAEGVDGSGRGLIDGLLRLVDFTVAQGTLADWELERIPPLQALSSGALARGLLRIAVRQTVYTLDAVSTPLRSGEHLCGSLTFFNRC